MSVKKLNTENILKRLKDFQKKTVDYVFERLYGANPVNRFLIADEVGLGKTHIAKGVIAKAIDHLWNDSRKRIDIVYICANRDIAAQNIDLLNITEQQELALASRLTLLPLYTETMNERLNFVSFTPGTSFDLKSKAGIIKERALMYRILRDGWDIKAAGLRNLLQGDVSINSWRQWTHRIYNDKEYNLNKDLVHRFLEDLEKEQIRPVLDELISRFPRRKENVPSKDRQDRNALIGSLRRILARSCLTALEPDVIILDEFQRFKYLLEGEDEVAQLAHDLFTYPDAKIILLSATPYKMYTMTHEIEEDNHYEDFLRTVNFLFASSENSDLFQRALEKYRQALYEVSSKGLEHLKSAKEIIENKLRQVMVRTERLAITIDRDGMVTDSKLEQCSLKPNDLKAFKMIDQISRLLDVQDAVEYWKSAPYLLNFMDKTAYTLKKNFSQQVSEGILPKKATKILEETSDSLLPWEAMRKYQKVDPCNAKLRALLANTIEKKAWQLLWIPPSLPYYTSQNSPFEDIDSKSFTKALIFSSWQIVPKVIATMCSYEAERNIMGTIENPSAYPDMFKKRRPLIIFSIMNGEFKGLRFFSLLYPCLTLAAKIDPMKISLDLSLNGGIPELKQVFEIIKENIKTLLEPVLNFLVQNKLMQGTDTQRADHSWYFAAMSLLDRYYYEKPIKNWCVHENDQDDEMNWASMLPSRQEDSDSRFADHIKEFWKYFDLQRPLGQQPNDLIDILAKIAIASPAVVCLRSFLRLSNEKDKDIDSFSDILISSAAKAAIGFRSLFNLPDSITLLRNICKGEDERYWETVLDYCMNGNIQSVMDEYVHISRESLGQVDKPIDSSVPKIAEEICTSVSLRTVSLDFDDIRLQDKKVTLQTQTIRCRFALRYGDAKNVDDNEETRADQVRKAFNSPFRPFILASTSVGQEGLDFHQYCHSIYHWNLPANPIDLEQREGRIHRYKGHVIRKNISYGIPINRLAEDIQHLEDPWTKLFSIAKDSRPSGKNDLIPYWIYETKDGPRIQRYIPYLPLSRDEDRIIRLKKTLAAYRMVFGQPRQDDLVAYLMRSHLERDISLEELLMYRIDLSPQ